MTLVYDSEDIRQSVLGNQKPEYGKNYRLLQFCVLEKTEDGYLLYNKMTGKLVLLNSEEYRYISKLPAPLEQKAELLAENWFIVPTDHNDMLLADQFAALAESINDKSRINSYTILTTTDCNARCFYCYQAGSAKNKMTSKTANDVADFIIKKSKGAEVCLKWFGGEPLYNSEVIDIITGKLAQNNIPYYSTMISNGYLFDVAMIKRAAENWKLKSLQVTLDGTEEIYNGTKAYIYKDNISPFKVVTDNIEALLKSKIKVSIRLNLSDINYEDLFELVDWLSERYGKNEYLVVSSALLYDSYDFSDEELMQKISKYITLEKYISEKGLSSNRDRSNKMARGCMAQCNSAVVISPTGILGKCEHYFENEKTFGSIYSDAVDEKVISYWKHKTVTDECKTCIDYLSCGGYDSCPNFRGRCGIMKNVIVFKAKRFMLNRYNEYKHNLSNKQL